VNIFLVLSVKTEVEGFVTLGVTDKGMLASQEMFFKQKTVIGVSVKRITTVKVEYCHYMYNRHTFVS
jgi:hypothetical protein